MTRRVRGRRIGFIPQDPYLALNPVFRSAPQLLPSAALARAAGSLRTEREPRAPTSSRCCAACRSPSPRRCSSAIRTSSPAASASA